MQLKYKNNSFTKNKAIIHDKSKQYLRPCDVEAAKH